MIECLGNCDSGNEIPTEYHRAPCRIWKQLTFDRLMASGCRQVTAMALVDGLKATHAVKRAKGFMESDYKRGRCLILSANTGAGKSVAAASIILSTGRGRVIHAADLHNLFFEGDKKIFTLSPLIIDDFGLENLTDYLTPKIDSLIDARQGNRRPTIITTNLNEADFRLRYMNARRITSRLNEWATWYEFTDVDYRMEKSNPENSKGKGA